MSKHIILIGGFSEGKKLLGNVIKVVNELDHHSEIITWRKYHKKLLVSDLEPINKSSDHDEVIIVATL